MGLAEVEEPQPVRETIRQLARDPQECTSDPGWEGWVFSLILAMF